MSEAIQLDETREDLLAELDWTSPLTVELCLQADLEEHWPLILALPPLERDVLLMVHYCGIKFGMVARILRTSPAKVSACLRSAELGMADLLLGAPGPWPQDPEREIVIDVLECPGTALD